MAQRNAWRFRISPLVAERTLVYNNSKNALDSAMIHGFQRRKAGGAVGFIGYLTKREGETDEVVRIFLECREKDSEPPVISYTYAVDVIFPRGMPPCRLRGVEQVLALKKFYKLYHSLEERARERGNPREKVAESAAGLLEHLGYTRNARDFTGSREPVREMK